MDNPLYYSVLFFEEVNTVKISKSIFKRKD